MAHVGCIDFDEEIASRTLTEPDNFFFKLLVQPDNWLTILSTSTAISTWSESISARNYDLMSGFVELPLVLHYWSW